MPFTTSITPEDTCLRITSVGTLDTVDEVLAYIGSVRKAALQHDIKQLLLDERRLMDQQDTHDAYEVSESENIALAALSGLKIACISHPDNYELNKNYETLLINRSLVFKAFLDEDDAIQWLTRQPSFGD